MNADKRKLKRIGLSVFIGVNRRLKMPFSDFFSSLLKAVNARAGVSIASEADSDPEEPQRK
jgi:hypothetical protein